VVQSIKGRRDEETAVKLKATEAAKMPLQPKLSEIGHTPLYKDCNDEGLIYILFTGLHVWAAAAGARGSVVG
jgi:hypothetical protein